VRVKQTVDDDGVITAPHQPDHESVICNELG
jgi:hypothetical protein